MTIQQMEQCFQDRPAGLVGVRRQYGVLVPLVERS